MVVRGYRIYLLNSPSKLTAPCNTVAAPQRDGDKVLDTETLSGAQLLPDQPGRTHRGHQPNLAQTCYELLRVNQ